MIDLCANYQTVSNTNKKDQVSRTLTGEMLIFAKVLGKFGVPDGI